MAQPLRKREAAAPEPFSLGSVRRTQRATKALTALAEAAERDPALGDVAVDLLEAAAAMIGRRSAEAVLPDTERVGWEALGADFSGTRAAERSALQTRAAMARLRSTSLVGDAAVAQFLGVDRSRVSQRLAERSLHAVADEAGRWFPRWQFEGNRTIPHLRAVMVVLAPDLHPLTVEHWFATPHVDLEIGGEVVSPRTWLVTGGSSTLVADLAAQV